MLKRHCGVYSLLALVVVAVEKREHNEKELSLLV